jgi:hypothetical protein
MAYRASNSLGNRGPVFSESLRRLYYKVYSFSPREYRNPACKLYKRGSGLLNSFYPAEEGVI